MARKRSASASPWKILCVHGIGGHAPGGPWEADWRAAIERACRAANEPVVPRVEFAHLDDIFQGHQIDWRDWVVALGKLVGSGLAAPFRGARGIAGSVRWTAGMVVQWVESAPLRNATRARLAQRIRAFQPDLVLAHSLGSLVAYDTFTEPATAGLLAGRTFVSFGSQINNPFVVGNFRAGRLDPLSQAYHWYHLYNPEDAVFTAPIRLNQPNFSQVTTRFDIRGIADHDAPTYLTDDDAIAGFWSDYRLRHRRPALFRSPAKPAGSPAARPADAAAWATAPRRRALLIGINDYPDPAMRLEGCVNDVYLVSATLQELGFAEDDIRVVLNERATAAGIRERLAWLLDGAGAGDERLLYFSGHGAQMPTYGPGEPDRLDESLVPYDFDWSPARAITDKEFYGLYSQLDYRCQFTAVFDCCHSGGLTRATAARVRGLNPPDDIRHRALRWDDVRQLWVPRPAFESASSAGDGRAARSDVASTRSHRTRLGHGSVLRQLARPAYVRRRRALAHEGPYMPVLLYACQENEFAYEYHHGAVPHGAFTFVLAKLLRAARVERRRTSYTELVKQAGEEIRTALLLEQRPAVEGPSVWVDGPIMFEAGRKQSAQKRWARKRAGRTPAAPKQTGGKKAARKRPASRGAPR